MILLWGLEDDPPIADVLECLSARGEPLLFVDQLRLDEFEWIEPPSPDGFGVVVRAGQRFPLTSFSAAYVRPHDYSQIEGYAPGDLPDTMAARLIAMEAALLDWCENSTARVVNRPSAMATNASKPYQLSLVADVGFLTPDTLITSDPDEVAHFCELHGKVIYKSISSTRSIVGRVDPTDHARLRDVASFPTMFQQWVAGADLRVHVIGERVFACEIQSAQTDYRYSTETSIRPVELPADVIVRCRRIAERLDLSVTGIDLRRTPDGEWYLFEANPSPGFSYYERRSGHPMADALADWLADANSHSNPSLPESPLRGQCGTRRNLPRASIGQTTAT